MSRTIRSKEDSHRRELRYRAHRGKHSRGQDKRGVVCEWCLRNISQLERDRKSFAGKYPKKVIEEELKE